MMSLTSILAMVTLVATTVDYVEAHGYIKDPPVSFIGPKNNAGWIAEIPPLWKGDWDSCKSDPDLLAMFKKLAPANNYKDLPTLMDGNPALGKKCGHTDPKAKPVPPPSKGQAVLSRPVGHAGECTILLNEKVVFQSDDCQRTNHDGVFEVDYSFCSPGGCMFRFYWLALQRLGTKTLWQSYKSCARISGPPGGKGGKNVSHAELSGVSSNTTISKSKDTPANKPKESGKSPDSNSKKDPNESKDSKKDSDKSKDSKKDSDKSKDSKNKSNETPSAGGPSTQAPLKGPSGGGGGEDVSQAELSGVSPTISKSKDTSANKPKESGKSPDSNSKKDPNESKDSKKDSDKSKDSKKDPNESKDSKKDSNESKDSKKESNESKDSKKESNETPPAGGASTQMSPPKTPESSSASSPGTPAMTPAPRSKCKGHRRRRY